MSGMQNDRQSPHVVRRALCNFGPKLTILAFALFLTSPLFVRAAQVRGADEVFPVVHDDAITIRILDGADGHPIPHAHLSLLAGYNRRDLHLAMWHDDVSTDDQGKARLPDELANLPFLEIGVGKQHICEAGSGSAIFSVDRIRRDGLSTSNRCGKATVGDAPGAFTIFVKSKTHPAKPPKPCKNRKPAPAPASAVGPASAPAAPVAAAPTGAPAPAPAPAAPVPRVPAPTITPVRPDDLRALAADRLAAVA
jgi:hypothetical protein